MNMLAARAGGPPEDFRDLATEMVTLAGFFEPREWTVPRKRNEPLKMTEAKANLLRRLILEPDGKLPYFRAGAPAAVAWPMHAEGWIKHYDAPSRVYTQEFYEITPEGREALAKWESRK